MSLFTAISKESGLDVLSDSPRDVHLLVLQRIVRMLAYGQSTLVLTGFLHGLGYTDVQLGLFMTLTMIGDVFGSLILTIYADRLGRRRILLIGALLMSFSGAVFAYSDSFIILLLAAMVGVISPSGNEIGPFRAIEESTMAQLSATPDMTSIFAWSNLLSSFAGATGSLTAGYLTSALQSRGYTVLQSYRAIYLLYIAWGLVKAGLTLLMSERCEAYYQAANKEGPESVPLRSSGEGERGQETPAKKGFITLGPETRTKLFTLGTLMGLDNLASGLVASSLVIYFFSTKFGLDESTLGQTFFTTALVAGCSNLFAASLARRIGNIKTMAFTHTPSSIFLSLIPWPSDFRSARMWLVLRHCTAQMDTAPRAAFIAAYIPAEDRTTVMGILNVVKTIGQSVGPTVTGLLAERNQMWLSFELAGGMKIAYDMGVLYCFSKATMSS